MLLRQEEVICTTEELLKDIRNYIHRYERDLKWLQSKVDKKTFLKIFFSLRNVLFKATLLQVQLENFINSKNSFDDPSKLADAFISACIMAGIKKGDIKAIKLIRDVIINKTFLTKSKKLTKNELAEIDELVNDENATPFLNFSAICQSHVYDQYIDSWMKFQALDQAMLHSLNIIDEVESKLYFKKNVLDQIKLLDSDNNSPNFNVNDELKNCHEESFVLENLYKQLADIKKEYAKSISEFDCSPHTFNVIAQKIHKIIDAAKISHDSSIAKVGDAISKTITNYIGKGDGKQNYFGQISSLAA